MKIVVYAISKNEEKFVKRWYNSMKEADKIIVLDTGSKDNTVKLLKDLRVEVKTKKYKLWRFDQARNDSLKLIPKDTDICVCTDLDETFNKGWRKELEKSWKNNTTRLSYTYNWSLKNSIPQISFMLDKIHSLKDYKWTHPVHEILENINSNENIVTNENIVLNHYPDNNKSRSSYLPLLELSVKENPKNDRNMHYLGREYMYHQKYDEAIKILKKHLRLKSATWKDERCASMRFIARSYKNKCNIRNSRIWLDKAVKECPYLRDPLTERLILEYEQKNYKKAIIFGIKALQIETHKKSYINEPFSWNETIHDILSLCYYYLNNKEEGLKHILKAIEINPKDKRLLNNKKYFIN